MPCGGEFKFHDFGFGGGGVLYHHLCASALAGTTGLFRGCTFFIGLTTLGIVYDYV